MRTYPKGSGGFRTTSLHKIKSSCDHHTRVRKKEKENDEHKDRLRTRGTAPVRRNPWDQARQGDEERKGEKKRETVVAEGTEEEEEEVEKEVGTPREIKGVRRS